TTATNIRYVSWLVLGHCVERTRACSRAKPSQAFARHRAQGSRNPPRDGCLSVGTASMPLSYIYHVWRRNSAQLANKTEGNLPSEPVHQSPSEGEPRPSNAWVVIRTPQSNEQT